MLSFVLALLFYPGLATGLALTVMLELLAIRRTRLPQALAQFNAGLAKRESGLAISGVILAAGAMALLPWPLSPVGEGSAWFWAWALLELAFLLPLLPALVSGEPLAARAAIRELQIGVAARALFWPVIVVGLALGDQWNGWTLVARLLVPAVGLLALPAATGWGPFSDESSISPEGPDQGLDATTGMFRGLARMSGAATLVASLLLAALPIKLAPAWLGLPLIGSGFVVIGLLLRQIEGRWPRLTLHDALRFCWLRILPLSVATVVCLLVIDLAGR